MMLQASVNASYSLTSLLEIVGMGGGEDMLGEEV